MRTLVAAGQGVLLSAALMTALTGAPRAQAPAPQGAPAAPPPQGTPAPAAPAAEGRGRGPQGPPLLPTPPLTERPTPDKDGNFVIGPPYEPAPELTVKDGVPKGTVHEFTMDSKDSKIYPGIARNQPGAWFPTRARSPSTFPRSTDAGTPAPFIVAQDGMSPTLSRATCRRSSTT